MDVIQKFQPLLSLLAYVLQKCSLKHVGHFLWTLYKNDIAWFTVEKNIRSGNFSILITWSSTWIYFKQMAHCRVPEIYTYSDEKSCTKQIIRNLWTAQKPIAVLTWPTGNFSFNIWRHSGAALYTVHSKYHENI